MCGGGGGGHINWSRHMRKTTICLGENKGANQRLCFRYTDSTLPLLFKSEISSFQPAVTVQPDLCQTWSETTLLVFPRGGSLIADVPPTHPELLNTRITQLSCHSRLIDMLCDVQFTNHYENLPVHIQRFFFSDKSKQKNSMKRK